MTMRRSFCLSLLAALLAWGVAARSVEAAPAQRGQEARKADVDLSGLNSLMAYTGVFNILSTPEAYEGKTIKLRGEFDTFQDSETGDRYFGVIVSDASACCATGLDFVLRGDRRYPEDYPKVGAEVTIVGTFEIHREGEDMFCRLGDAELL